ncbi:MAG: hypothetical protein ACKOX3_02135 [Bacteroidota bacterium]
MQNDKLIVLDSFVKEVSKELNVKFSFDISTFQRGIQRGKKYKIENFISPIYRTKSNEYELSFIPYSTDSVELWKINVNERGKGIGSEIMSSILDVSDRTGIKVKLVPVNYDEDENTPKDYFTRLRNWYSEGFEFQKPKLPFDQYFTYYPSKTDYKMVG